MGKLWIEDQLLRLDNNEQVRALAPAVIAASRVTDIPAHYCDWFFERLRRGYAAVPVVGATRRMHRYVSLMNTQFIVFFSKNPRPLIPYLPRLKEKDIDFYINYTLNDYSRLSFESGLNVEEPLQMRIDTFKRLAEAAGPERVVWHFDPLILAPNIRINDLMERISSIAEQLKGYTNRLVFGFLNVPKDSIVQSNLKARKILFKPWSKGMKAVIVQEIAKANKNWGFELATCSNDEDYRKYGVEQGRCVDYNLITRLAWRNEFLMDTIGAKIYTYDPHPSLFGEVDPLPNGAIMLDSNHYILPGEEFKKSGNANAGENECRCHYSYDIGTKGTCTYKCAYCFAAVPSYKLDENVKGHSLNPTVASITGEMDSELHIPIERKAQPKGFLLDRSLKSYVTGRMEFDEVIKLDERDPYHCLAKKLYSYKTVFSQRDIDFLKSRHPDPYAVLEMLEQPLVTKGSTKPGKDKGNKDKAASGVSTEEPRVEILPKDAPFIEKEKAEVVESQVAREISVIRSNAVLPKDDSSDSQEDFEKTQDTASPNDKRITAVISSEPLPLERDKVKKTSDSTQSAQDKAAQDKSSRSSGTQSKSTNPKEKRKKGQGDDSKTTISKDKKLKESEWVAETSDSLRIKELSDSEDTNQDVWRPRYHYIPTSAPSPQNVEDEVIIDPDDEIDPFIDQIIEESESADLSYDKAKEEKKGSKTGEKERNETAPKTSGKEGMSSQKAKNKKSTKTSSEEKSSKTSREETLSTLTEKEIEAIAEIDSEPVENEGVFNAQDYLKKLRESGKFKTEKQVKEAFIRKVNRLIIGSITGVKEDGLPTVESVPKEGCPGNEEVAEGTVNPDDQAQSPQSNTGDQQESDSMYGFLKKPYPSSGKDPDSSPEQTGTSNVTDYEEVHEEILKAQVRHMIDAERWEAGHFLEEDDQEDYESGSQVYDLVDIPNPDSESNDGTSDNPNEYDIDLGWGIGVDRKSLRNMMKKK